ncbi:hypothetical protein R8Z50_18930 [Longispora sp. K20-0274]|uniref:hypothetical protein n=1 Tax=Longispora sp. K20-0274 TaxID=3088255 RepID=UPI00399C07B1
MITRFSQLLVAAVAVALLTPGVAQASPPDLVTSTTLNATEIVVDLAADQNARITFPATAGARVVVAVFSGTYGVSGASARLLLPDGTQAAADPACGQYCELPPQTLPTSGSHTVVIDPVSTTAAGSVKVVVYETALAVAGAIGAAGQQIHPVASRQLVAVTFAGTAGERISLRTSPVEVDHRTLTAPDGTVVFQSDSAYGCSDECLTGPLVLPATGTYTYLLDTGSGGFTFWGYDVPADVAVTASIGGPAVNVAVTVPGQNATVTFAGTAGQRISLRYDTASLDVGATLRAPGGAVVPAATSAWECPAGCASVWTYTLPETGDYPLLMDPSNSGTGTYAVQLFALDVTEAALAVDGSAASVSTTHVGELPTFRFTGAAGQRLLFAVDGHEFPATTAADVINPDGTFLKGRTCGATAQCLVEDVLLTQSGEHLIRLNNLLHTGTVSVRAYNSPANPNVSLALDAAPVTLSTTAPGQTVVGVVPSVYNHRVGVRLTGGTFDPNTRVQVLTSSGTVLAASSTCGVACYLEVTGNGGNLQVLVDPPDLNTGAIAVAVSDGRDLPTGTALGDPAVTLAVALPAQRAVASFAGTAGQKVLLSLAGGTYGTASNATATLRRPDGGTLATANCGLSCAFEGVTLPTTGTYTLVHDPKNDLTGTISLQAWSVAADRTIAVTADGSATTVNTTPGQNAALTFPGTAGQRVAVRVSAGSYPAAEATVVLRRPDGSTLAQNTACGTGCFLDTRSLPVTGTYTVLVDPKLAAAGAVTVQIHDVPADVAVGTTVGGGATPVAVASVGQNAVVSFSGAAGQTVTVAVTGATFGASTGYVLRRPDGSTLASKTSGGANTTFAAVVLPAAGTYSLLIDPANANTGTATVTVS